VSGDVLGDADDRADARVHGLVDGVGRKSRRHEDERGVRARLGDGLGDGVEHRDAFDVLAALTRRHARDDVRAVVAVAQAVNATFAAGQPLDDETRVPVDDDGHYFWLLRAFSTIDSNASMPSSIRSAS